MELFDPWSEVGLLGFLAGSNPEKPKEEPWEKMSKDYYAPSEWE
ncbi:MAG: hypothetical protein QXE06_08215 [Candidatus Bathyarchaeia archaeon]